MFWSTTPARNPVVLTYGIFCKFNSLTYRRCTRGKTPLKIFSPEIPCRIESGGCAVVSRTVTFPDRRFPDKTIPRHTFPEQYVFEAPFYSRWRSASTVWLSASNAAYTGNKNIMSGVSLKTNCLKRLAQFDLQILVRLLLCFQFLGLFITVFHRPNLLDINFITAY